MSYSTHLCDDLSDIKDVASFVVFTIDLMGHHNAAGDMSSEDCRGLSKIMSWVRDQIGEAKEAVSERLNASEMETFKRLGVPEEALLDERMRRAWRDGFSHGLAHTRKEVEK